MKNAITEERDVKNLMNDDLSPEDVFSSIQRYFEDPYKDDKFNVFYQSNNSNITISFTVEGIKRELGQTLDSTGLTIWRASEHLCQYIVDHYELFIEKQILELGGGLGMVSILLDKLNSLPNLSIVSRYPIICSDGDHPTIELLNKNINLTNSSVISEKLYWNNENDISSIKSKYSQFPLIIAADVIYEDEQIIPLLSTVNQLLLPTGQFILAYARRNVPIDKVIEHAKSYNLKYTIIDEKENENIYSFYY